MTKGEPEDSVAGAGEMVWLIKCLACKVESLSSEYQHPCKMMEEGRGERQENP